MGANLAFILKAHTRGQRDFGFAASPFNTFPKRFNSIDIAGLFNAARSFWVATPKASTVIST